MRPLLTIAVISALLPMGCGKTSPSALMSDADRSEMASRIDRLAPAVQLMADGQPIEGGYPAFGDFDGDGRVELLLGAGNKGRLSLYRNVAGTGTLRLVGPQWFDDRVPTGRIPKG